MPAENPSSKPRSHPVSDPYDLKRWKQESQVILQRYIILLILHIIYSLSSRQRYTRTRQQVSMRISHIGVRETSDLLSRNISQIYDKEKHEQMKAIIFE